MKKIIAVLLSLLMIFCLYGCGKATPTEQRANGSQSVISTPGQKNSTSDQNAALEEIVSDFDNVTTNLMQKLEETFTTVGTTYESYQKNKELIDKWISLVLSESDTLFARTKENSIKYFKLIAADEDHKYSEFCDEALDEYYDTVYDKAMDEYYDNLYDDAMDDLYDEYYDGIIDDAYDDVEYSEWYNALSECYKTWYNGKSEIYKKWYNEKSYIYGLWSTMNSAFCWNDNFDVDAIVDEYEKKIAEENIKKNEEESETFIDDNERNGSSAPTQNGTSNKESTIPQTEEKRPVEEIETPEPEKVETEKSDEMVNGMRKEFKEAMDSYESYMDSYVEFMKTYDSSSATALIEYSKMLMEYANLADKFEKWNDGTLNNAELSYYIEVQSRVNQKLLSIS